MKLEAQGWWGRAILAPRVWWSDYFKAVDVTGT